MTASRPPCPPHGSQVKGLRRRHLPPGGPTLAGPLANRGRTNSPYSWSLRRARRPVDLLHHYGILHHYALLHGVGVCMADLVYRATFSLPADQAVVLSNVAKRMGCSQSAVVTALLEQVLPHLAQGLGEESPTSTPRRLRGESGREIRRVIAEALSDAVTYPPGDLF